MYTFLIAFHVILCIVMVIVVLLQQGQGSDLSSVFGGGGGSSPILGGQAAMSFMNKVTIITFILFLATSITISIVQRKRLARTQEIQNLIQETVPETPVKPPAVPQKPQK